MRVLPNCPECNRKIGHDTGVNEDGKCTNCGEEVVEMDDIENKKVVTTDGVTGVVDYSYPNSDLLEVTFNESQEKIHKDDVIRLDQRLSIRTERQTEAEVLKEFADSHGFTSDSLSSKLESVEIGKGPKNSNGFRFHPEEKTYKVVSIRPTAYKIHFDDDAMWREYISQNGLYWTEPNPASKEWLNAVDKYLEKRNNRSIKHLGCDSLEELTDVLVHFLIGRL